MIAILLCTYNGERYIKEQLDSLLAQTEQRFVVYIHDDGSTDDTMCIIRKYTSAHPAKFFFMDDDIKHRGAGASFMWLLEKVEADYYMFCDQDDVWQPKKIENTLARIKEEEDYHPDKPVLIHTDLTVCDSKLNTIHPSFWKYQNFKVDISKRKQFIAFGNIVTGCTMIINRKAKDVAFPYDSTIIHDYWLALCVAAHGYVDNLKEQTILYRQHNDNVAGIGNEYKKNKIRYKHSVDYWINEYRRFHHISGYGFWGWLYYHIVYFYNRHFK